MANICQPPPPKKKRSGAHASDRRLTWEKHIKIKRNQLNLKAKQMHWLLGRTSLPIERKLLQYKAVSNSNIEILQRFQSKALRSILNEPWYMNNHRIHEDLEINTVLSGIKKCSAKYLSKL
jgi:hypothetical protein